MLSFQTKSGLIATALCAFSHVAWADSVFIGGDLPFNVGDYLYGPPSMEPREEVSLFTLLFSDEMLRLFDAANITLTASGSTVVRELKIADAFVAAASTITVTSYQYGLDKTITGALSQSNGLTFSVPNGTSVTLMDWDINTQTGEVSARAISSNDQAPIDSLLFWQAETAVTENYQIDGPPPMLGYSADLMNLIWSDQSRQIFNLALGLDAIPTSTTLRNLGSISLASESMMPAIPEPSTYTLMGLGLVGIGIAARRRQAH